MYSDEEKNIFLPSLSIKKLQKIKFEKFQKKYKNSLKNSDKFWLKQSKKYLKFNIEPINIRKGTFGSLEYFSGGKLNACYNCIDRHLLDKANKPALIFEADNPINNKVLTFQELSIKVNKMANLLKKYCKTKNDVVGIYMTISPEAVITMLACTRIGIPHSVIFAGFSAEAVRQRLIDSNCKIIITQNTTTRRGKIIPLKETIMEAIKGLEFEEDITVLISGKGLELELENESEICELKYFDSENPLFILYTSGSTGKPKGLVHSTAGYLLYVAYTLKKVFNVKSNDIFACVADIGWITGHSYVVYGPLMNGNTSLLFGSTPDYPSIERYWETIERWGITHFYTAPTAIRYLKSFGKSFVKKYNLSTLKVIGTVGEPINPKAWNWYFKYVGKKKCWLVDTYWQTETGGIIISPIAGVTPLKRGCATLPFYGIDTVLLDSEQFKIIKENNQSGVLAIKNPWPGIARTILRNHKRYLSTYFKNGFYITGDSAYRDIDGYYFIKGRIDDVLNVSGHRIGTAELESALTSLPICIEAAVVGFPHKIKGEGIFCFCVLSNSEIDENKAFIELKSQVAKKIGKIVLPDQIVFVKDLPKTRSGKILRRILRSIAHEQYEGFGDLSTIQDASVLTNIVEKTKFVLASHCSVT